MTAGVPRPALARGATFALSVAVARILSMGSAAAAPAGAGLTLSVGRHSGTVGHPP
jgi:hypothetical protein